MKGVTVGIEMFTSEDVAAATGVQVEAMSQAERMETLDVLARRFLGMSGREFVSAYTRGDLPDSAAVGRVASCLPLVR
ncbi:MAG: hypothetical protein U0R68_13395 [Candidatus Nanopelagicales bacterium]